MQNNWLVITLAILAGSTPKRNQTLCPLQEHFYLDARLSNGAVYGWHKIVVVLDPKHSNVTDRRRKPRIVLSKIHDGENTCYCINLAHVPKVDATLLAVEPMKLKRFFDVRVGIFIAWVMVGFL